MRGSAPPVSALPLRTVLGAKGGSLESDLRFDLLELDGEDLRSPWVT
jgi:hypothetical protein